MVKASTNLHPIRRGVTFPGLLLTAFAGCLLLSLAACSDPGATSPAGAVDRAKDGAVTRALQATEPPSKILQRQTTVMPAALRLAHIRLVQQGASSAYRVSTDNDRLAAEASNPAHGLKARFSRQGIKVLANEGLAGSFGLNLRLSHLGYQGALRSVPDAAPVADGNRVAYRRSGGLTEWYLNGPLGLEQGFTLATPPAGPRSAQAPLVLSMTLSGDLTPDLGPDRQSVTFHGPAGEQVLVYRELYVQDATGRLLPAELGLSGSTLSIRVHDAGAVYPLTIDPLIAAQSKLTASDAAAGDRFGRAVSISGDYALIGAFEEDDGGNNAGAAYIFWRGGSTWSQQQKLTAADAAAGDNFGLAVAISGDHALVGACMDDDAGSQSGAAYLFVRNGTTWSQQQKLTASDAAAKDFFGWAVAMAGSTAVVGARDDDSPGFRSGSAYVFVRSGTTWSQQQKLTASDAAVDDRFGYSVAVHGDLVLAGANEDDDGASNEGSAYVFARSGTTWSQQTKLTASDSAKNDFFGWSVGISADHAVVGARLNDQAGGNAGAAYVYAHSGTTWSLQQKLTASDAAAGHNLGGSVAIEGDALVVGADNASSSGIRSGAAYVFLRSGTTWSQQLKLTASDGATGDDLGWSVSISGLRVLAGAPLDSDTAASAGSTYSFEIARTGGMSCTSAAQCQSGFCADGVCCDSACGGGSSDCQACSMAAGAAVDGTCSTLPGSTTCRAAIGACDTAETCDGTAASCPADTLAASGTTCRASASPCDAAETCDGASATCPADKPAAAGATCRAATDLCDQPEACDGIATTCPVDKLRTSHAICRTATGPCDAAEYCDGTHATCPKDIYRTAGEVCRGAGKFCDKAESCTGATITCPTDIYKPDGEQCMMGLGSCETGNCKVSLGGCSVAGGAEPGSGFLLGLGLLLAMLWLHTRKQRPPARVLLPCIAMFAILALTAACNDSEIFPSPGTLFGDPSQDGSISPGQPSGDVLGSSQHGGSATPTALRAAYIRRIQTSASPAYRVRPTGLPATFEAINPARGLLTRFASDGVRVEPEEAGRAESWSLGMRLTRIGYQGSMSPVPAVEPVAAKNRVEYRRAGLRLTEWYLNGPLGLEQGFTLEAPPAATRSKRESEAPLMLEISITGGLAPLLSPDGKSLVFRNADRNQNLVYRDLHVQDAGGQPVSSDLVVVDGKVAIRIRDHQVKYPLIVDPLLTTETKLTASDARANQFFGESVAIYGSYAAIGAPQSYIHAMLGAGAVYVFYRPGTLWYQKQKLTASDATSGDWFGGSVAISGGNMAVGAMGDTPFGSKSGSAYVFNRTGTTWSQQAKLAAYDGAPDDRFGWSIAISGSLMVVGAYGNDDAGSNSGSAYVFRRIGTAWNQEAKLTASDAAAEDRFGDSVAIYGDSVVVGAYGNGDAGSNSGSAYIYHVAGITWSQEAKLTASDAAANDNFGDSVAIYGDSVVVGAYGNDDAGSNSGSAYAFRRTGTTWTQEAKLTASDAAADDRFSNSVAIAGSFAVAGAHWDSDAGKNSGSAYLFYRAGTAWYQQAKLTASDAAANDRFGKSVDISGDNALIGAFYDDYIAADSGSTYVYKFSQPLVNGIPCMGNGDCASGYCVDSVCCNSTCGGGGTPDCLACSKASGAVTDGICGTATAGATCRAAAGGCDLAETCSGTSSTCPADVFQSKGTVCRAAPDLCDVAETCLGSSASCPVDGFKASGTLCRPAAGDCDVADVCGGSSGSCPADLFKSSSTICRSAAGPCDWAESCTGATAQCPADSMVATGTVCRKSAGLCDVPESCNGLSTSCPADALKPASTLCRKATGPCDAAETCSGSAVSCPADALHPLGTTCRAAASLCDAAETCSGISTTCPGDKVHAAGYTCRSAAGLCDMAELCSGSSIYCPQDSYKLANTACRASVGLCDLPEICTGFSGACPSDVVKPSSTTCRASGGSCDPAENCDGSSGLCPMDLFKISSTVCRAVAGPCDLPENCTGKTATCPADMLKGPRTACRAAAGPCDQLETCSGASAACPLDQAKSAGMVCRPAMSACDAIETCDGLSNTCPTDGDKAEGASCAMGLGSCTSGECQVSMGSGCSYAAGPGSSRSPLLLLGMLLAACWRRRSARRSR